MNFLSQDALARKNIIPGTMREFIEWFNRETNVYLKVADLAHFFDTYSEDFCIVEEESTRTLFLEFVSKIPELFDEILKFDNNAGDEFQKKSKLECYCFLMSAVNNSYTAASSVPEILLIIPTSLILLYKGYSHCKNCESIYGESLVQYKAELGSLFDKMRDTIEELQSHFFTILKPKLRPEHFHLLKPIVSELTKLCDLVFFLESTDGMVLYKLLIRLIENYKEMGRVDLKIDSILAGLFSTIKQIGDEYICIMKKGNEVAVHETRMLLCMIHMVHKIIKIFPSFLQENFQITIQLVLNLYELLISCYQTFPSESNSEYLKNILLENINPVLYSEKTFLTSVLLLDSKDISPDFQTHHLMLKLSALSYLIGSVDKDILINRTKCIQNIFMTLGENTPRDDMFLFSLKLPMSLFMQSAGLFALHKPQSGSEPECEEPRSLTLYYHAYIHISEYSRGMTDSDVKALESFVVDFLHRNSSVSATILISDVWIYRLRHGSIESFFARCLSFAGRLSLLPDNNAAKLLLKRMLKFLPLNLKERLLNQLKVLDEQGKSLHRYGAPLINNKLPINENNVSENITALLDELKKQDFKTNDQLIRKACLILELCASSIKVLEMQEFLRFAEFSTIMFKSEIYEIQIAVLTFLRALNYKKFNDKDPMFADVRSSLAILYNEALTSKNYLVRFEALSIFYIMAQFTDIRMTQETIANFPELYPSVKAYVSENPEAGFIAPEDKNKLLEKQSSNPDDKANETGLSDNVISVLSVLKSS